jgi:hypothetical protein
MNKEKDGFTFSFYLYHRVLIIMFVLEYKFLMDAMCFYISSSI